METRIIDVSVQGQEISCSEERPYPRTNTKKYLYVRFSVDELWDGLKLIAVFRRSGTTTAAIPLDADMMCEMPPQMLAVSSIRGPVTVYIGIIGISEENGRLTTGEVPVIIEPSCYVSGKTPPPPTPDVYEELLRRVEDAEEIDPEEIRAAIDAYLRENPIDVEIMSESVAGIAKVGDNLRIDSEGRLSVDTADSAEEDNTRPITSAAVFTTLGNIDALLGTI